MTKHKLTWRDLSWSDFKTYLFALFKAFVPKKKITDLDELEDFIQSKSAWVTQVTLYGYLKTRILDDEINNKMPNDIIEEAKKSFEERLDKINWNTYHNNLPFNPSALSLYKWAPIADELKTLDRKIVLNSVILKWNVVKKEFKERLKF